MRILLVNPRGFCAGVHMAIQVVDQALDLLPDETIYVYHEIVHNKHVVNRFRERGVRFIEDLSEAEKPAYILADNRLAEDAGWDREILAIELQGLLDIDVAVELTGFEAC